ncbi:MAG TPA: SEC-C metal-binding domain-containing protein [Nitrospiria bacterium]|nr:SEC-C metal-binding domain-containing protein [Nitrospiria bacterium]
MTDSSSDYAELTDDALLGLLFTEADRLPRAAADEIIARGPQLVHPLTWLAMDPSNWQADFPAGWAPIHATYLLGAISGEDALMGLLTAAEHAESVDCDWVLSALPAIFSRMGARARPHLSERVRDVTREPLFRAAMAECLAATVTREPSGADAVFAELGAVFADATDETLKALVGGVLLDFQRGEYRDALLAHAREQAVGAEGDDAELIAYTRVDVDRAFAPDATPVLDAYTDDWLAFYSPEEIAARQARWDKEDAEADDADVELGEEEWEPEFIPQVVRLHPKIGRNDPCRCGSGKKYKQCCLERDATFEDLNLIGP